MSTSEGLLFILNGQEDTDINGETLELVPKSNDKITLRSNDKIIGVVNRNDEDFVNLSDLLDCLEENKD